MAATPGEQIDRDLVRSFRSEAPVRLAVEHATAHEALAAWVGMQLQPLCNYGKKLHLTVFVDGGRLTVKVEPAPVTVTATGG